MTRIVSFPHRDMVTPYRYHFVDSADVSPSFPQDFYIAATADALRHRLETGPTPDLIISCFENLHALGAMTRHDFPHIARLPVVAVYDSPVPAQMASGLNVIRTVGVFRQIPLVEEIIGVLPVVNQMGKLTRENLQEALDFKKGTEAIASDYFGLRYTPA